MKLGAYIQEGKKQIVLTPENSAEVAILKLLDQPHEITVMRGSFKEVVGGYIRPFDDDSSTFLVLTPRRAVIDAPQNELAGAARGEDGKLRRMAVQAQAAYDAMSPEEKAAHDQAQRESWARANMSTGDPRFD